MTSPRILMICGDFPPFVSGVGDFADKLSAALQDAGADVTLLTSAVATPAATAEAAAADASRRFGVLRTVEHWGLSNRSAVIKDCLAGYDLIQLQYPCVSYGRSPLINLLPSLLRLRRNSPPTVVTIHDFRVMRKRWQARVAPMLWGVNGLIHVDERDWPFIRSWGYGSRRPRAHIPIAANAQPVPSSPMLRARQRGALGFVDGETVVAFFGILYPHKGLTELVGAVQDLRAAGRSVRLLVLGDFDREADYRPAMEKLLADDAVKWVRGAELDEVSRCLHAADLAALPFHSGASTNRGSMLTTLAHGLPTITTDGPCTPPDFAKHFDVLLVPVNDRAALAAAIARLDDDKALARRMRESALSKPRGWDTVAGQTLEFYRSLIASRSAATGTGTMPDSPPFADAISAGPAGDAGSQRGAP
jgi:glycosyltransferase involved in cell wall biosynthesis